MQLSARVGHITLFWKHTLTSVVTAPYDLIALKDADIALPPRGFVVEVEHWMAATNASIVTPAIASVDRAGRGVVRAARRSVAQRTFDASCAAVHSSQAEQVRVARRVAFDHSLRSDLLLPLDDALLVTDAG